MLFRKFQEFKQAVQFIKRFYSGFFFFAPLHGQPIQGQGIQNFRKRICLEICDDGRGFDLEAASAEAGHFGLSGMRERAEKLGGQLRIESRPGHGTRVYLEVHINPSRVIPATPFS